MSDVIKYSSNIGAAKMGFMLGATRVLAYLSDFGFARPTGLKLPGEVAGLIRGVRLLQNFDGLIHEGSRGFTRCMDSEQVYNPVPARSRASVSSAARQSPSLA